MNLTQTSFLNKLMKLSCPLFFAIFMVLAFQQVSAQTHYYSVNVTTGDKGHAATDDYVFITIKGTKGSFRQLLPDLEGDDFQNLDDDYYLMYTTKSIGTIWGIAVEICDDKEGNTPGGDGWYIHSIWVADIGKETNPNQDLNSYPYKYFLIDGWLDDADNYLTKREFGEKPVYKSPSITKPSEEIIHVSTNEISKILIANSPLQYKSTIADNSKTILESTETNSRTDKKDFSLTVGASASTDAGLAQVETHFEMSTSLGEEVMKELTNHKGLEREIQNITEQSVSTPKMDNGQACIIKWYTYEIKHKESGYLELDGKKLMYNKHVRYEQPSFSQVYDINSQKFKDALEKLQSDKSLRELLPADIDDYLK